MSGNLDKTVGDILAATSDIPKEQIDQLMETAAQVGETGQAKTLDQVLVEEKVIDAKKAAEIKKQAQEVQDAPQIPGYTLLGKLGEGGMGAVYKALQTNLQRQVAMKILGAHLAGNKDFVARFYREARASAALDHPNVVRGYDVGEANGVHYFAMELVDGKSAQDLLDAKGPLSVGDACKIVYDVALALEHAQEHNMVHRDIKPDNIMITRKGVVKLADLGLAKQLDDENSMTQTGSGFGTPYYMAPEQAKNAKYVDGRSDIYALGATLYHLLAGKVPFPGTTAMEVLIAKERATYPKLSSVNGDVSGQLSLVVDKMMAKDPGQRQQTATDLIADLDRIGQHNDQLSFVAGAKGRVTAAPRSTPAATAGPSKQKTVAKAAPTKTGRPVKAKAKAKPAAPVNPNVWYLRYTDAAGKPVKAKADTNRIRKLIVTNQLNDTVEASHSPRGPFRKLQTYAEFEPALRSKIARKKAEAKSGATGQSMADLIENIDDEQARHRRRRALQHVWTWIWSLILTVVVLGGGGAALWKFAIAPALQGVEDSSQELQQNIQQEKKRMGRD